MSKPSFAESLVEPSAQEQRLRVLSDAEYALQVAEGAVTATVAAGVAIKE